MQRARRLLGQVAYRSAVWMRGEDSVFERLKDLRRFETGSRDLVGAFQENALRRLLVVAANVPYYADLLKTTAGDCADPREQLGMLPILTKTAVQKDPESFRTPNWSGRVIHKTTGGSTGRPVTITKDAGAVAQEMAATWLGYGWFGVRIGDPCVRFWGQPIRNLKRRARYLAADVAMHRLTLSAFGYDAQDLRRYLRIIHRFRPRYLYGYVSALEDLARTMLEEGVHPPSSLTSVVSTSEVLTGPQRALMERAFGVPIQNEYGCGEVGPIAYECRQGSLHLLPTNQLIEIVDVNGGPVSPGEAGSVLVTDLTNHAMPLIRYRVGDTAAFADDCSCGRPFPTIRNVLGREYDYIEDALGRRYHGEFFMYIFEDLRKQHPEIEKFQVIQVDLNQLVVRIVAPESSLDAFEAVGREFGRRLEGFSVSIDRIDRIARLPSGKTRIVENRIRGRRS